MLHRYLLLGKRFSLSNSWLKYIHIIQARLHNSFSTNNVNTVFDKLQVISYILVLYNFVTFC